MADTDSAQRQTRIATTLVFAFALLLWLPTLGHALVWDDVLLVSESRFLARASFPNLWKHGFWHTTSAAPAAPAAGAAAPIAASYYRPFVLSTLWLEWRQLALGPWLLHLSNALVAAAVASMVLVLCRRLLGELRPAVLAALLFAVHPAHVESVAFIAGRTNLWCTLFALLALLALDRERPGAARIAIACVLAALAALSKESGLLFPALWLLWRSARAEAPGAAGRRAWLGTLVPLRILVPLTATMGLVLLARSAALGSLGMLETAPLALGERLAAAAVNLGSYVRMLLLPVPHSAWHVRDSGASTVPELLWLAGALAVTGLSWRNRAARLGMLWLGLTLLPVSGLRHVPGAVVAERHLFLPSVGLCFAAGAWLARPSRHPARTSLAVATLLVLAAADLVQRSQVWRDDVTLFGSITRDSPGSPVGWSNLALAEIRRGRAAAAEPLARRATELAPDDALAWGALGRARLAQGQAEAASAALATATRLAPDDAGHWTTLGWARAASGDPAGASQALERALALDPELPEAWLNLAQARGLAGDYAGAETAARRAVALAPENARAHNNLGAALLAMDRMDEAIPELQAALRADPLAADALFNLVEALVRSGRANEAATGLSLWLAAHPESPAAGRARARLAELGAP